MYFIDGKVAKTCKDLSEYIQIKLSDLQAMYTKGRFGDIKNPNLSNAQWCVYEPGIVWANKDDHAWFKIKVIVPDEYKGKSLSVIITSYQKGWDATNPQFIVYLNGQLIQGVDINHTRIKLTDCACPNEVFEIDMEGYSGMISEQKDFKAELYEVFEDVKALYYDLKVPLDIIGFMDDNDKSKHDMLRILNETCNIIDFRKPGSDLFHESVREAHKYIKIEMYEKLADRSDTIATCTGHTHIDVAWLWTVEQTREKTARSFSTVLRYMDQYPEYIFMSSQPQLYKFLKEDYPEVYLRVKEKVAEGRWEAEGGMWLEADCNVTSGESLVRQILFGKTFFKEEFGIDNKIVWLPDVFGYNAAMPQIMKKAGIDYFMTTKINWNRFNKMPYDTFIWKGLDGTGILTHFITTQEADQKRFFTTYNGMLNPSSVIGAWRRYGHKTENENVLISYGYGDGGGGPTEEMIENIRRMNKGLPGCPKTVQGKALDYFNELDEKFSESDSTPKWTGELYLEYHRGTYTSMGRNKRANRKCEFMLHDIEFLYSLLMKDGTTDYPGCKINSMWETVLLNQFHDILPGSSIKQVYDVTLKEYEQLLDQGKELIDKALDIIGDNVKSQEPTLLAVNSLGFNRNGLIEFKSDGLVNALEDPVTKKVYDVQQTYEGKLLSYVENIPSKGYKAFNIKNEKSSSTKTLFVSENRLQNKYFDIKINEQGNILSIYDKVNERHVLKSDACGNVFQVFEDRPRSDENWNIEIYYPQKKYEIDDLESIQVIEAGPVRGGIKIKRKFFDSYIVQDIYIYSDIPRIDFDTVIDWKEKQLLLKTAFPVNVHAEKASYDIQFGNVERTTHTNTSWDVARYEVCAHKWADSSQFDFGVSLLNDCKYGHDIREGVMRLTLLKSGIYPNPDADKEVHRIKYSLVPHAGTWRESNIPEMGYDFNVPMYVTKGNMASKSVMPCELSLFRTNGIKNVIMETVKKCEWSDEYIIRVYECFNMNSKCSIWGCKDLLYVKECDLMENDIADIATDADKFTFEISPYEIKTFKVKFV